MSGKHFMKGATFGAVLASVATLLLAPKAGKKTREEVTKIVKGVSEQLGKELEQTASISKSKYEEIVKKSLGEYAKGKNLASGFLADLTTVFKKHFSEIADELSMNGAPKKKKASKK